MQIEPFRIAVSEATLADLSERLARTRFPDEIPGSGWTYCAIFPGEMVKPPRRWAERAYNVQRWTRMSSGGHFAAMEGSRALVDDIRAFFRPLRQA